MLPVVMLLGAFGTVGADTADAYDPYANGGCIKVHVYEYGQYVYSYCGAYFYAGSQGYINMGNTGGGWSFP